MSIFVDKKSRVLVQGLGREGLFHAQQCRKYGTQIVSAVKPGKGGTRQGGITLFDTVQDAVAKTGANVSLIFVPAAGAADAMLEAIDADVPLIVAVTEHVPVRDMVAVHDRLRRSSSRLIGPNCPGIISPGKCKVGIMPGFIHKPGRVGVVSRSGTLTYEAVAQLTALGIGQSTCIGIGGDPIVGTNFIHVLAAFNDDPGTDAVIMIGEIGGTAEEEAATWVKRFMDKPVVAFIAGQTAPPGRRMGHAGAIISGGKGTAAEKMSALRDARITVCENPGELGKTMAGVLDSIRRKRAHAAARANAEKKPKKKKKPAATSKGGKKRSSKKAGKKRSPRRPPTRTPTKKRTTKRRARR